MALNYANIATTTFQRVRSDVADAIFKGRPGYNHLLMGGRVRTATGGKWIEEPVMYGRNTTVGAYSKYDTLTVTPTEELTMARYHWRQVAGSVIISGYEERVNAASETQILPLLQWKMKILQESYEEYMNDMLFSATTAKDLTKDLLGLEEIIEAVAGSSQGTLGNINKTTYSWWRNKYYGAVVNTGTLPLYTAFNKFVNDISEATVNRPTAVITTQGVFEALQNEIMGITNPTSIAGDLRIGFENYMFKGIPVFYDPVCLAVSADEHRAYFINSKFLSFTIESGRNFVMTPFREPVNQDARVAYMLMMGNLTCSNPRFQGVMDVDLNP